MTKRRMALLLVCVLHVQGAQAFFDPPWITPASPLASEPVSVSIHGGGCDAIARQLPAEESSAHRDSERFRRGGRAVGRLDAETRDPGFGEVLQKVPVIRRHLENEGLPVEPEAIPRHLEVAGGVCEPCL